MLLPCFVSFSKSCIYTHPFFSSTKLCCQSITANMSASKIVPVLTAPMRLVLLDPRATSLLLAAVLYYPDRLRRLLPPALHPWIFSPSFVRTLSAFLGLGVVRSLNKRLSRYLSNNWKSDAKFVKSQEIVLITGGASGIGELMAKDFAGRGVKVVVLDLRGPKVAFRKQPFRVWRAFCTGCIDRCLHGSEWVYGE